MKSLLYCLDLGKGKITLPALPQEKARWAGEQERTLGSYCRLWTAWKGKSTAYWMRRLLMCAFTHMIPILWKACLEQTPVSQQCWDTIFPVYLLLLSSTFSWDLFYSLEIRNSLLCHVCQNKRWAGPYFQASQYKQNVSRKITTNALGFSSAPLMCLHQTDATRDRSRMLKLH